ncbi:MAG: phosphatase PAP2 family protein [Actinobacteria bacterium]|nr:MAG: phosphatase PAP2 family protein [Actinomycetota bacterium]TMK23388.1 MAG: phosphatase PAP2 family protein [Actinomycetota bacterium]TMK91609.1 MAG: phosphatase PAP2 family protein [Actinomycetota bacterium]
MSRSRGPEVGLFLAGAALFGVSLVLARRPGIDPAEEEIFRAANDAPDAITLPVRSVMQMGTFGTVPAISAVALLAGKQRLAAALGVGGAAAWVLAKQVKVLGGRSRPEGVLMDVRTREKIDGDLGWLSGHAAVATTIAFTAWPATPRWSHPFLVVGTVTTAFGRMFVGAHLPLDLVGGAGLGMMVSAVARRLLRD